jgi:glycosyltransferase involved in cell wall biosynthesis
MHVVMLVQLVDYEGDVCGFTHKWVEALACRVSFIDVLTLRKGKVNLPENVKLHVLKPEGNEGKWTAISRFYQALFRISRHSPIDVIFCHMTPIYSVVVAPYAWLRGIPIVTWYAHGKVSMTLRLAHAVSKQIVTSTKEGFRLSSNKVQIVGQGIDTETYLLKENRRFPHCPFTILTVSRLSPIKRVDLLIEAVTLLRQKKADLPICLKIVGGPGSDKDHSYIAELKRQVEFYQLQDTVIFEGSVPFQEVVFYYQDADCFVNMSETGSVDKAVLEAMSCGVAVVVNDTFTQILGEELAKTWVIERDAELLCERLLLLTSMSESEWFQLVRQLRNIIVRDHNLDNLMDRIVQVFGSL